MKNSNFMNNNNENNLAVRLSYSSMKLLQSCEQRYSHYKIQNTPKDSDYVESEALGLGKAFHQVLELNKHISYNQTQILEAMEEHKVDPEEQLLLEIMLKKYVEFRKASGLDIVVCEFGIDTGNYVGFIDAIAVEPSTGLWWIIDLKTSSRHDPNIIPQLSKDMQLGLYSHFKDHIESHYFHQTEYKFGGFKYCQTIKSKANTLRGLENGVKVYEITIPANLIAEGEAWKQFNEVYNRAIELHSGEAPRKNYASCFSYFSPCPYFSQCHKSLFTKPFEQITVTTIETLKDSEELL